jgi:hypothetical protein
MNHQQSTSISGKAAPENSRGEGASTVAALAARHPKKREDRLARTRRSKANQNTGDAGGA